MLKRLRHKKTARKIWIGLAVIIVPAFVLWGSGSLVRSKREAASAQKLLGKNVSVSEFKDALDAVRNQAIMQFGENFWKIQKYLNLESQAWERLMLLRQAKKRKIRVRDNEVIELIEASPEFKRGGRFDHKIYSNILRHRLHTLPRVFEEQTRQNIILAKLYEEVTDGIKVGEEELVKEYQKLNEEVELYYIASLVSEFQKGIEPLKREVKDYFNKNSLEFKQPLSFNIEYIASEVKDKIANAARDLEKRTDLKKIAEDSGLQLKETGLFSLTEPIPGIGWSPEILNLITDMNSGESSPLIQTDKYYYVFRLKEKKEPYIPDFKEIEDKAKEMLIKSEARILAENKIRDCLKRIEEMSAARPKSVNFQRLAKELALKSGSTKSFKYGSYIDDIGASDNFWMAAQELKEGEFSTIINEPSGFYIIKLKTRTLIDEDKFAEEKAEFNQTLLLRKKQEHFAGFLEELKKE